ETLFEHVLVAKPGPTFAGRALTNAPQPGKSERRAALRPLFLPSHEGMERRRGANKLISALWARRASLAKDTQRHSALHCGFCVWRPPPHRLARARPSPRPPPGTPRRTAVLPSWLSPQASREPGYEPNPQAPHSRSASGPSRETPLDKRE